MFDVSITYTVTSYNKALFHGKLNLVSYKFSLNSEIVGKII